MVDNSSCCVYDSAHIKEKLKITKMLIAYILEHSLGYILADTSCAAQNFYSAEWYNMFLLNGGNMFC